VRALRLPERQNPREGEPSDSHSLLRVKGGRQRVKNVSDMRAESEGSHRALPSGCQGGRALREGEPSESHSPQRVKGRDRECRKSDV